MLHWCLHIELDKSKTCNLGVTTCQCTAWKTCNALLRCKVTCKAQLQFAVSNKGTQQASAKLTHEHTLCLSDGAAAVPHVPHPHG
jgi:hypothetical protein